MKNNEEWDYQGKRKDQVESSYALAVWSLLIASSSISIWTIFEIVKFIVGKIVG